MRGSYSSVIEHEVLGSIPRTAIKKEKLKTNKQTKKQKNQNKTQGQEEIEGHGAICAGTVLDMRNMKEILQSIKAKENEKKMMML